MELLSRVGEASLGAGMVVRPPEWSERASDYESTTNTTWKNAGLTRETEINAYDPYDLSIRC